MPRDDRTIIDDIENRIIALNRFGEVARGASPGQEEMPPERSPCCWIQRAGWREADRDGTSTRYRSLSVRIWIDAWGCNPREREAELVALEDEVCAALNGKKLGGISAPAYTTIGVIQETPRPAEKSGRTLLTLLTRYRRIE